MGKPVERRSDWYQSVELPDKIIEGCGNGSRGIDAMNRRWEMVTDHLEDAYTSFLDVGCAEGGFLAKAANYGFSALYGVEVAATRRERALETLYTWVDKGLTLDDEPVIFSDLYRVGPWFDGRKADITICFSMLHYVRDVFHFLDTAISLTKHKFFFEFPVQPENQDTVSYRGDEKSGVILPWWLLRDRMSSLGTIEVISDPNKNQVGRRIIGCLSVN